jgi:hypothetical protein
MRELCHYVFWARFKRQDMYLLWKEGLENDPDTFWTDDNQKIPACRSKERVAELAQNQGLLLKNQAPERVDFDAVVAWMDNPKKIPPAAALMVWNIFTDLSKSIGKSFDGDTKSPVRNRVFDLLYVTDGIWGRLGYPSGPPVWPRQERKMLRRTLLQGFRLWNKHVYWAD